MKRLYLLLLGIIPCLQHAYAQETRMPVVKPVSPSAAGIFKTLDRPIGSYTGTVPVNFPLFKIASGPLETSISLDYNSTGGIKVEEMATNVGLGFNLAAGGRITRIQKGGISDDDPNVGYLINSVKPSQIEMYNTSHLIGIQKKSIDLEPDIFMYSFNGESGKFFFNEAGKVIMMQESNVKVQYFTDAGGIKSWTLYDRSGNKYYFTLKEQTTVSYQNYGGGNSPSMDSYASSWLLTEIKDINNQNAITFSYQQSSSGFFTLSGGNKRIQAVNYSQCDPDYFDERIVAYTETAEYILTKVSGNSGYVAFNSSTDRLDLNGGSKLLNLTFYDQNHSRRKNYHFNYDYFVSGDAIGTPNNNPNYKRLKLKSFSEFGENNMDSLNYSFSYNDQEVLPQRLSYAVDYWGFYNGQINNASPLPNITSTYYGQTIHLTNFSNKEVASDYAKACILTKITYPTGGSREFTYEGNTALLTSDSQIRPDPNSIVAQEISRTDFSQSTLGPCLKQTFKIDSYDGGTTFSYMLFQANFCSNYSIRIYAISSLDDEFGGALLYTYENEQSWSQSLNNGMYRLEVYRSGSGCNFANLQLNWEESTFVDQSTTTPYGSFTKVNREVGGVRVKEIKDFDPVSAKTFSTKYLYKLYSTDSTLTSGLLNTPVRLMNEFNTNCSGCRYMLLYTTSCYPLASDGGSFVVYPEVRTIEDGNGWTDRKFTYSPDDLNSEFEYPIPPLSTEPAKLRGKLLSEMTYDKTSRLLKENTFMYDYIFIPDVTYTARGAAVKLFYSRVINNMYTPCVDFGDTPNSGPTGGKANYHDLSGVIYGLAGKSEKSYSSDGSYIETKTFFSYDTENLGSPIIKQSKVTVGNNKTKETNYLYAFNNVPDFKFGLTGNEQIIKSNLLDSNYLQPIEVSYTLTNAGVSPVPLGGEKYIFDRFNGTELHLGGIKEYTSNTDYKETVFSAYQNGRLLEKFTVGGPKEVYLWGYNYLYPVAKIVGSNYNALTNWFSPSILNNPSSETELKNHLNTIRVNLLGESAQVDTYSYKTSVGMSSQTDAKGMTTYYEYDNFQRLKYIKDQAGNIIKSYDYHYKP